MNEPSGRAELRAAVGRGCWPSACARSRGPSEALRQNTAAVQTLGMREAGLERWQKYGGGLAHQVVASGGPTATLPPPKCCGSTCGPSFCVLSLAGLMREASPGKDDRRLGSGKHRQHARARNDSQVSAVAQRAGAHELLAHLAPLAREDFAGGSVSGWLCSGALWRSASAHIRRTQHQF
jgi:hypothetical protein